MSRAMLCLAGAALAAFATPALAASPFDGTWKGDPSTAQFPTKPDTSLLKNGIYTCSTCIPPLTVKADGQFHKVTGHPYYDETMIKVVDARTVEQAFRRGGKDTSGATATASPDGKTLTVRWHSADNPDGKPTSGEVTQTRVGTAPAGAHATSGSWRTAHVGAISPAALLITFSSDGQTLNTKLGTGENYSAKFGGPAVPMVGDPAKTMVTVRKTGPRSFLETDSRAGKVVNTFDYTFAPDGKTVLMTATDKRDGSVNKVTFTKQ